RDWSSDVCSSDLLTEVPLPCPVALHTEGAEKYGAEHLSKAQSVAGRTVLWLLVLAAAVLVVFAHGCLLRELTGRAHNRISAQCLRLHSMAKITEAMTRYRLCNSHTASSPPPSTGPMRQAQGRKINHWLPRFTPITMRLAPAPSSAWVRTRAVASRVMPSPVMRSGHCPSASSSGS